MTLPSFAASGPLFAISGPSACVDAFERRQVHQQPIARRHQLHECQQPRLKLLDAVHDLLVREGYVGLKVLGDGFPIIADSVGYEKLEFHAEVLLGETEEAHDNRGRNKWRHRKCCHRGR